VTLTVMLKHKFPETTLDIEFNVPTPGVTALFGPSGSGKSSTVAAVAGLMHPQQLRVTLDDVVLADTARNIWLPPERRRLGMVFQDARLFPHLRVEANLRYGLRRAPPGPIKFDDVVELLGIGDLLRRRPHTLSGGEKQRVAIGRALLSQPLLLLMDEPLASLDLRRRDEILPYLARLKTAMKLPVLYVTHAADEVQRLADTLVMIEAGKVETIIAMSELAGTDPGFGLRPPLSRTVDAVRPLFQRQFNR
jgi:molybdate transport system ATP-binding protein